MGPISSLSAKPANPIESAIDRQGNALGKLEDMVEALINRLSPALGSDTPKSIADDQRDDSSGSSTLARDIDGHRRRIEALDDRLGCLIDKLEL